MDAMASPEAAAGEVRCVFVLGPTATGKTALAVGLARVFGGEVVSADSRQVYRGLDLGTGKDVAEYGVGAARVAHHLIDVAEPLEDYHLFRFVSEARAAIAAIAARGRLPIVAGGSGLYVNALLDDYGLDGAAPDPGLRRELESVSDAELMSVLRREAPDLAERVDAGQRRRLLRAVEIARSRNTSPSRVRPALRLRSLLLGPYYPRATVHERIARRLDARLEAGMVGEVAALHANGLSWERLAWFGLEYRCVGLHLQGKLSLAEMREVLLARIRQFCRAQDVWFRKMERAGKDIHWIPGGEAELAADLVGRFLAGEELPPPVLRLSATLYGPQTSR
jgi:tRNA dimethylallyltransferase